MLERVPATAESAAHVFLRSFERPRRSSRLLDTRFWQHDCDQLAASSTCAAWWPQYLQKIRQVPQAFGVPNASDLHLTKGDTASSCKRQPRVSSLARLPRRAYSVTTNIRSTDPAPHTDFYDAFGFEDHDQIFSETEIAAYSHDSQDPVGSHDKDGASEATHSVPASRKIPSTKESQGTYRPMTAGSSRKGRRSDNNDQRVKAQEEARKDERWQLMEPDKATSVLVNSGVKMRVLNHLLDKDENLTEEELDQIWRLFIALPDQETTAQYVFTPLARTKIQDRMHRATEALHLMPVEHRDFNVYKKGVELEIEQDNVQEAIDFAVEANRSEIASVLYMHLVRKELWSKLGVFLLDTSHKYQDFTSCAEISELPEKILRLQRRVKRKDPTLANFQLLSKISRWLSSICLRSESIMTSISIESLLGLLHMLHGVKNESHTPALRTLSREGVRTGKKDIAVAVYRDFLSLNSPHKVNHAMLGSLLSTCAASGYSPELCDYVLAEFTTHFGKPDLAAYLLVLTIASRQGTIAQVESLFKGLIHDHEVPPNIRFVSPLIHVCARMGEAKLAQSYFGQVKAKYGFEQDAHCWNMLLSAYGRSPSPASAFDVFERMTAAGIDPDSYTYGTLIAVCADLEDPQAAQDLIVAAREAEISVTVPMIGALVDAFLSHDDFYKARDFVVATTKMKTSESLTRLWNSLLRHCAAKGNAKLFVETRNDMQQHEVEPDDWTHATMLIMLTSDRKTNEAVAYLRTLQVERGFLPSKLHYSIVLHGFVMEDNRDMVAIIQREVETRFSKLSADAELALFASKVQGNHVEPQQSLDLLASSLRDLEAQSRKGAASRSSFEDGESTRGTVQAYTNIVLYSLLRNNHLDLADRLVKYLEKTNFTSHSGSRQVRSQSVQYSTLRMDAALAQSNFIRAEQLWREIFQRAVASNESRTPTRRPGPDTNVTADIKPSTSSYTGFQLSKPLNRYMEAMARQKKQGTLIRSIEQFESAGFKLSGINWNKYVQVMARSSIMNHHIMAFKMTDTLMLGRSQSWTLLRRGLLRQKNTSYIFDKTRPEKPRPVLTKKTQYSAVRRLDTLYRDPARKIPTYTTMVYLARVLDDAQRRAQTGDAAEITTIGAIAGRTKHFLERMPRLKDNVQGEVLRSYTRRPDHSAQPRYEKFHQSRIPHDGFIAKSLVNTSVEPSSAELAGNVPALEEYESNFLVPRVDHDEAILEQIVRLDANAPQVGGGVDKVIDLEPASSLDHLVTQISQLSETAKSSPTQGSLAIPPKESMKAKAKSVPARVSRYRQPALRYVERRKERKRQALQQRQQSAAYDNELPGRVYPPSPPQSAAARRLVRYEINQQRRSGLLEDFQTKGRPSLAPLPDTKVAYRRRRRVYGMMPVRFVLDLNRSKKRHAIRSGKIPETRQGLAKVNQREHMVDKITKHLLLDRQKPILRHHWQIVRGKITPNKYLVKLSSKTHRAARRRRQASVKSLQAAYVRADKEQEGLPIRLGDVDVQPLV